MSDSAAANALSPRVDLLLVADMVSVRPLSQGDAEYLSCEFNVTVHA